MADTPYYSVGQWYDEYGRVKNKVKIEGGIIKMENLPMNEIVANDLKKKVEKIRNDRKKLIDEVVNLLHSDVIFLSDRKINDSFKIWLIENKFFFQFNLIKKKRKTIEEETPEYIILRCLSFYHEKNTNSKTNFISFYGEYREKCPYFNENNFYILELNGETWLKYELILNKIKKAIPGYLEHFYKKELLRLCDKKFTYICEKCGTKNEKCAVYCNICGVKLNEM